MGLTPIDLFNDILVTESDLRSFLWQNKVDNCSVNLPGIIIQAYITFCEVSNSGFWTSRQQKQRSYSSTADDSTGGIAEITEISGSGEEDFPEDDFSETDDEEFFVNENEEFLASPKTSGTPKKRSYTKRAKTEKVERIKKAITPYCSLKVNKRFTDAVGPTCEICNPSSWQDGCSQFFKIGTQARVVKLCIRAYPWKLKSLHFCQVSILKTKFEI